MRIAVSQVSPVAPVIDEQLAPPLSAARAVLDRLMKEAWIEPPVAGPAGPGRVFTSSRQPERVSFHHD